MNEEDRIATAIPGRDNYLSNPLLPQRHASPDSTDFKMMELEIENSRLQRLVAELLLKNQQLRKAKE